MPKPELPGMLLSVEAAGWLEGRVLGGQRGRQWVHMPQWLLAVTYLFSYRDKGPNGCWWFDFVFPKASFFNFSLCIIVLAPSDLKGHPRSLSIKDHLSE